MATTGDETTYQPVIHQSAEHELMDVPPGTRDSLVAIVKEAARYPEPSSHSEATTLWGHPMFRVKYNRYRALCTLQKPELQVLLVSHREGVYDRIDEAVSRM